MFLERKSSLRASFLDVRTDPHLFFETPFNLGKETEWEEQWESRGSGVICSAACPSILEPCGECTLVREGRGESALTGCAVLITSRFVAGSVRGVADLFLRSPWLLLLPEQKKKSQLLTKKHHELAAIVHQNHFSVKEQACRISSWVTLSWLRICQNTLIGKKKRDGGGGREAFTASLNKLNVLIRQKSSCCSRI